MPEGNSLIDGWQSYDEASRRLAKECENMNIAQSDPNGEKIINENKAHHSSCIESDKVLMWHCFQCGLDEDASEILSKLDAADLEMALDKAEKTLKEIAEVRERVDYLIPITVATEAYEKCLKIAHRYFAEKEKENE